jgi:glycosyltransferase involved in cell wall biosynthesis
MPRITVGLVTTVAPELCGHRTYAEELVYHANIVAPEIAFKLIGRPFNPERILQETADVDVVHINHAWQLFSDLTPVHIAEIRNRGQRTVCTFHESSYENRSVFTCAFDRVVVHQKTIDGFTHIRDGIWAHDTEYPDANGSPFIGTVGFPIGYKNLFNLAEAVNTTGYRLLAYLPESPHAHAAPVAERIRRLCPGSQIYTDFHDQRDIITAFAHCAATAFPSHHAGSGIGGSVRLGIAARRPVVISRVERFSDLWTDYVNEFYVVNYPYSTANDIAQVLFQVEADCRHNVVRKPVKCAADMSWMKSAEAYCKLYNDLCGVTNG